MKTVSSKEFRKALEEEGFRDFQSAFDRDVNCPSIEWLKNDFSAYMSNIDMPGFEEAADCDDWSMFAKVMAGYANGLSGSKVGVAFAVVKITIFPGCEFNEMPGPGTHLTNAVMLDTGEIVAYEPQTQTIASFKDAAFVGAIYLDWVLF